MKDYSIEQKQALRDRIIALQEASGLSGNAFAVERLGFSNGSKFSHVRNNYDKPGMVGTETWEVIEKYIQKTDEYHIVVTRNLKKVWETCERAYTLKCPMCVEGEGGFGKTTASVAYQQYNDANKRFKVVLFDAKLLRTPRTFIRALMLNMGIYKHTRISDQLAIIREHCQRQDMLLIVDEVSDLQGHNVVVIKYLMDALKDVCGIVFTGTPYFINNINSGALRNRHLFSELRDRLFMLPEKLLQPNEVEALEIFKANGINSKDELDVVLGRKPEFKAHSWLAKKTFRGIRDCIDLIKMANLPSINYETLKL